jgi:hypothetical protein
MVIYKIKGMKVKTIHGIIEIDPPAGYPGEWKVKIDGYLYYKGFRASHYHSPAPSDDPEMIYGEVTALDHAGFFLEGRNMEEFTRDFHECVDEFLLELRDPSHPFSRRGISYYTSDPAILSYYATHYGHVESSRVEPERVSFPSYVLSLGMSA